MRNILYYDLETHTIKNAQHVRFDEGMNDLAPSDRPPNAKLLLAAAGTRPLQPEDCQYELPDLDIVTSPFHELVTIDITVTDDTNLGLTFDHCTHLRRVFIKTIRAKGWSRPDRRRFTGSYVVTVGSRPVFTVDDTHQALAALSDAGTSTVRLTLALDHSSPMVLRLNDLRSIFTLQHGLGEKFNSTEYNDAMAAEADHDLPDSLLTAIIHDLREDASGIPTVILLALAYPKDLRLALHLVMMPVVPPSKVRQLRSKHCPPTLVVALRNCLHGLLGKLPSLSNLMHMPNKEPLASPASHRQVLLF
jgi:hypothetical protein